MINLSISENLLVRIKKTCESLSHVELEKNGGHLDVLVNRSINTGLRKEAFLENISPLIAEEIKMILMRATQYPDNSMIPLLDLLTKNSSYPLHQNQRFRC